MDPRDFRKELKNKGIDDLLVNTELNTIDRKIKKRFSKFEGSGISLTNKEAKEIIKVIRSLENRGTLLLKGTTRKISQKGGPLNCFALLTRTVQPLLKNVLPPLAKSVLVPLGLIAAVSAIDAAIQKKILGSSMTALILANEEMEDGYHENS